MGLIFTVGNVAGAFVIKEMCEIDRVLLSSDFAHHVIKLWPI